MTTETPVEILLVEDNPQDAELTLRALLKRGLANHVRWVKDGAEAVDYIFGTSGDAAPVISRPAKLILLDLKLPRLDGLEVLRRLKADKRTNSIPVVVLTSSRQEPDIEKCYQLGANSYIVKPVEFENFSSAVAQLGMYWLLLNQEPRPVRSPEPESRS